jgi:hypothetical protein
MNEILKIPFAAFNNDWNVLQKFLERRGYPPYMITGDLSLVNSKVKSLGNLTSVGGNLDLRYSGIESLGNLTSVGGYLDLVKGKIESFGNLKSVGSWLDLEYSKIKDLGNLISVGGHLYLTDTPLSKKYSEEEIRSMVEVGRSIYF